MAEKIRMDGQYKTRCGIPVRIICVDLPCIYPVVAAVMSSDNPSVHKFTNTGSFYSKGLGPEHSYDLIPVPEPIPEGVCYHGSAGNFHRISDGVVLWAQSGFGPFFDYLKWESRAAEFPTYESVFSKKPISTDDFDNDTLFDIGGSLYFAFSKTGNRVGLSNVTSGLIIQTTQELADIKAKYSNDLGETWHNCWK